MPPKKKSSKKTDDWDADLGETPDPIAAATEQAKEQDAVQDTTAEDEEMGGGGGLLAALKKNRGKKAKKGKVVEDLANGEDVVPGTNGVDTGPAPPPADDPGLKAPQEADMEAEDVFATPGKKGKGAKGGKASKEGPPKADEDDEVEEDEDGGKVKSKKEKEKEKKEREKQRKKEQVC